MTPRRFTVALTAIALVGFTIRVAYVLLERRDVDLEGDPLFYHVGANLLADGHGFVEPLPAIVGRVEESASHPPLYLVWLAIPSLVGLGTPLWHMLWSLLPGTATVVLLGLVGREVAGERVGIIAALLAAVYVNLWVWDGFLVSETAAGFTVALVLLLAYRFRAKPSMRLVVGLGAACGLAALARAELALLVPLVVIPLVLLSRTLSVREQLRWIVVSGLSTALVLAPWIAFNLSRFDEPVLLSTGLEPTLLGAYCDDTFEGDLIGYFSPRCVEPANERVDPGDDQSERNAVSREIVAEYVGDNTSRLPAVVAARLGRVTGLYRPRQQLDIDHAIEGRERWVARAGLVSFYLVATLAVAGAVMLRRRRRVPAFPLLAPPAIVLIAVATTLASIRYRASAEGALVVLAAVSLDAIVTAVGGRRGAGTERRDQGIETEPTGALTRVGSAASP